MGTNDIEQTGQIKDLKTVRVRTDTYVSLLTELKRRNIAALAVEWQSGYYMVELSEHLPDELKHWIE